MFDKEMQKAKALEDRLEIFKRVLKGESYRSVGMFYSLHNTRIANIVAQVVREVNHPSFKPELVDVFTYNEFPEAYFDQPELTSNPEALKNTFNLSALTLKRLRTKADFLIQYANMRLNPMGIENMKRASSVIQKSALLERLAYEIKMFLAEAYKSLPQGKLKSAIDIQNSKYITDRLTKMAFIATGEEPSSTFHMRQIAAAGVYEPQCVYTVTQGMYAGSNRPNDLAHSQVFTKWQEMIRDIRRFHYVSLIDKIGPF